MQELLQAAPEVGLMPTPEGRLPLWLALHCSAAPPEQRRAAACTLFPHLPPGYSLLALQEQAGSEERATLHLPLVVELLRQRMPLGSSHLWSLVRWAAAACHLHSLWFEQLPWCCCAGQAGQGWLCSGVGAARRARQLAVDRDALARQPPIYRDSRDSCSSLNPCRPFPLPAGAVPLPRPGRAAGSSARLLLAARPAVQRGSSPGAALVCRGAAAAAGRHAGAGASTASTARLPAA